MKTEIVFSSNDAKYARFKDLEITHAFPAFNVNGRFPATYLLQYPFCPAFFFSHLKMLQLFSLRKHPILKVDKTPHIIHPVMVPNAKQYIMFPVFAPNITPPVPQLAMRNPTARK